MNSGRSHNLSLKYQRFAPSSCLDIGVRKFEFVTKTQLLSRYSIVNQEGWERAYSVHKDRTSSVEKYEAEIRKQKNKQFSNGLSEFF